MPAERRILHLFVLVSFLLYPVLSLCPYECDCRDEPSQCPAGVSLVTDGCNCCKVCAKQRGEECDSDNNVCDVHRNLFCDFTASRSGDWGVCRARSGRPCWHGDTRVDSGSMFEPTCKKRCWCMDGAVGCVPLCPHETQIPRQDLCPNARLQTVAGQCCEQWACDTPSGEVVTLPLDDFWNEYVDVNGDDPDFSNGPAPEIGNGIRDGVIYEDDVGENMDELRDYQMLQTIPLDGESTSLEDSWHDDNNIPGDVDAREQDTRIAREGMAQCRLQASAWSPCSKSCGLGVSTRVTNANAKCQLAREQRLCEMRPCNDIRYAPKKGRHCLRQKRARKRVTLRYAGCVSMRKTKPRYCGSCHAYGKCCTPKATRTDRIRFRCDDGRIFSKNLLVVRSCHCHKNCASLTFDRQIVHYSLFGDMLRSRER